MTTLGNDGEEGFWHSIYAGADRFTRGSAAAMSSHDRALAPGEAIDEPAV